MPKPHYPTRHVAVRAASLAPRAHLLVRRRRFFKGPLFSDAVAMASESRSKG